MHEVAATCGAFRAPVTEAVGASPAASSSSVERAPARAHEGEARTSRAQPQLQRSLQGVGAPDESRVIAMERVATPAPGAGDEDRRPAESAQALEVVVVAVQHQAHAAAHRTPQRLQVRSIAMPAGAEARPVPERDPAVSPAPQAPPKPAQLAAEGGAAKL